MLDVEDEFFGAQLRERAFQRGDIERRLAAELLIDHSRIGSGLFHDPADAPTRQTVGGEFHRRRPQYLLTILLGGAARPAARHRPFFRIRVGCRFPVGHQGVPLFNRSAQPGSSSARSWPADATTDKPTGQPSTSPTGTLICGSPAWPAIDVIVSARW